VSVDCVFNERAFSSFLHWIFGYVEYRWNPDIQPEGKEGTDGFRGSKDSSNGKAGGTQGRKDGFALGF